MASAYRARAHTPFEARTWSDTSRADLKSFSEADCPVSSNPYIRGTPATDSRRSADPTSRMGQAKWRIPHVRFVRDVPHSNARHVEAKGIGQTVPSSSSRHWKRSNWKLKTYGHTLAVIVLAPWFCRKSKSNVFCYSGALDAAKSVRSRSEVWEFFPCCSIVTRLRCMRVKRVGGFQDFRGVKLQIAGGTNFYYQRRASYRFYFRPSPGTPPCKSGKSWKGLGIGSEFSQICSAANNHWVNARTVPHAHRQC